MASQPLCVLTPSCRDSKISRARLVVKSTTTLRVRWQMVSPIAIGLEDPFGLRRTMMEAPHTYGRTSSGTSPLSKRLTTSERSRSRSEFSGRIASRTCEGRSRDWPAQEVDGNDRRASRTWSTSAEGAAPGATRRSVSITMRSSTGRPGWRRRREATTSSVGRTRGSCKSAAQARRRGRS